MVFGEALILPPSFIEFLCSIRRFLGLRASQKLDIDSANAALQSCPGFSETRTRCFAQTEIRLSQLTRLPLIAMSSRLHEIIETIVVELVTERQCHGRDGQSGGRY
ncbi:hypothetical protein GGE67_004144 [Rhizobium leucaenae]|nr:hypothetical protein [Rhizobium leucaenae]